MLELAIVVPTFEERDNIRPLLAGLDRVLAGVAFEVIFVDDDSPDGTAHLIRQISVDRPEVRVLHRIGRRGLASACVEGMLATAAPYIAVMDADLQHEESILPDMLRIVKADPQVDLVVASRNADGGSMGDFAKSRLAVSNLGRKLSNIICRCRLTDPMSGFFLLRRTFMEEVIPNTSAIGFKILVDLISSCQRTVVLREVPYRFRRRRHGTSKLDTLVLVEYSQLVADKLIGQWIPPRFVLFGAVGMAGAVLYLTVLALLYRELRMDFRLSLVLATIAAMTSNFALNNIITYRDLRLKGAALFRGLLTFYAACSVGAVVSVRVSELVQLGGVHWLFAGAAGILIASVWNYSMTQFFTWRIHRKAQKRHRPAAQEVAGLLSRGEP